MSQAPQRAHELVCKIGADTQEDLVYALEDFARRIVLGELGWPIVPRAR